MTDIILQSYKKRIKRLSTFSLLIELSLFSIVIKTIPGILLSLITTQPIETTTDFQLERESELFVFITAVLLAPPIETVLGQWIPIFVLSRFTKKIFHLILWSSFWFALWHIYAGWESVLIVWFPGMIFSLCFIALQEHSFWRAYCMTTLVHAIHNMFSLVVYFSFI